MSKDLQDQLLDFLKGNPLWEDFASILDRFNQEQVLSPVRELENIRNIGKDTDRNLVNSAVRQTGICINSNLMESNAVNIHKLFYMFPIYHELSGTPKFPKFIEFLLGRSLSILPLFTTDYKDFYPKPKGLLISQGGPWYLTSHVELSVNSIGLDEILQLSIEPRDIQNLRKAGFSESLINDSLGKELSLELDDPILVKFLIDSRMVELYYDFAPIEDVVHRVTELISVSNNLYFSGSVLIKPKEYLKFGGPGILGYKLIIPSVVYGYQPYTFKILITLEDGGEFYEECSLISTLPINSATSKSNIVTFVDVIKQTEVMLSLTYMGNEFYAKVQLIPSGVPALPDEVYIVGPSVVQESLGAEYTLYGIFGSDRKPVLDQDQVLWTSSGSKTSFIGNKLNVSEIFEQSTDLIKSEYSDVNGVSHHSSYEVVILNSKKNLKPTKLVFGNSDSLSQGKKHHIEVSATYSDGSSKVVDADLSTTSKQANFDYGGSVYSPLVYRDFDTTLVAEFQDMGVSVKAESPVTFKYDKTEIFKLTSIVPRKVFERSSSPLVCVAHWCLESDLISLENKSKTEEEVELFTGEVQADWASSGMHIFEEDPMGLTQTEVIGLNQVSIRNNVLEAPVVDKSSALLLKASVITENGRSVSTTSFIEIMPIEKRITSLSLVIRQEIRENEINSLVVVANWTDSTQTELFVGTHDSYEITLDVIMENNNSYPSLYFEGNLLKYTGEVGGIATVIVYLSFSYTNLDGSIEVHSIEETTSISVVPKVILTDSIRVVAPRNRTNSDGDLILSDKKRMFILVQALLVDGNVKDIFPKVSLAPTINADSEQMPLSVVTGKFSLRDMVVILTGKNPEEIYADLSKKYYGYYDVSWIERNRDILFSKNSKGSGSVLLGVDNLTDLGLIRNHPSLIDYPEFENIRTMQDLDTVVLRTLVQATVVHKSVEISMSFQYFKEELDQIVIVEPTKIKSTNTVLSKRIRGPMEFEGNVPSVSYALYINFADGGDEYAVSNTWLLKIQNKREILVELGLNLEIEDFSNKTDLQLNEIFPDNKVVEIDGDGYVRPRENVDALILITAKYKLNDDYVMKSIEVKMTRANTHLDRLSIIGPSTIEDIGDVNSVEDILTYIPFKVLLWKLEGDPEEVEGQWTLEQFNYNENRDLISINVGEVDGKLYIKPQIEDQDLFLVCRHEEQFEDRLERVETRKKINIIATQAIRSVDIHIPPVSLTDDSYFQLEATVTKKSGFQSTLSEEHSFEWLLIDSPEDFEISQEGLVKIPKLHSNVSISITLSVTSGSLSVDSSVTLIVEASNSIQALRIVGYSNVRDSSVVQMQSILYRQGDIILGYDQHEHTSLEFCLNKECVTSKCRWSITKRNRTNLDGVCINESSGLITIGMSEEDYYLDIEAKYTEIGQNTVSHTFEIKVFSSVPRFGLGLYGYKTRPDLDLLTGRIKNLIPGGSFNLNPGLQDYGYFAHRKDLGNAEIKSIKNRVGFGGWGAANWPSIASDYTTEEERGNYVEQYGEEPIEITVSLDNSQDTWYLYRTERKNFNFDEFAYYFSMEEK
jgi:hypothetical protein